jgi:hypothetical protein
MQVKNGNLSSAERIASALLGVGLTVLAARRGGPLFRTLGGVVGTSLIGRAFAGHCAMKAAWTGESSFTQGIADQWQRTSEIGRQVAQRVADSTRQGVEAARSRAASIPTASTASGSSGDAAAAASATH